MSSLLSDPYVINRIYKAMEADDSDSDYLANVAITAADAIKNGRYIEVNKNNTASELHREAGNIVYKSGSLQKALISYNKALAYAPNGSLALKLAYSNRSAVLFSAKEYGACGLDCKMALSINCPTAASLTEKIKKRMLNTLTEENKLLSTLRKDEKITKYSEDFFTLKSKNSEIPCASADVGVVVKSQIPKVVAKKDIPIGTLVAVEKAFVSWGPPEPDQYMSCFYCRKLDLNLFPCSGCVSAMFCSKQCEESCMMEYHNVECQFLGKLMNIQTDFKWLPKVLIKLRNMCTSWEEFIMMSFDYGYKKISKSTPNDIYDVNNPSSVLSFIDDRHFLHGALYKAGLINGIFLNLLRNVESFLPEDWTVKITAIAAIARILMYIHLYCTPTILPLVTNISDRNSVGYYKQGHRGLFTFVGKLKHCCTPNLQMIVCNDTIGLLALEPIKAGTELTVSHIFHWLENEVPQNARRVNLLLDRREVCTCFICSCTVEQWARIKQETTDKASLVQKKAAMDCLLLEHFQMFGMQIDNCFEVVYKTLAVVRDIPFSLHYEKVYRQLMRLELLVTQVKVKNVILSDHI